MSNTVTLNFKADTTDLRRGLISLGEGFSNFEGGLALTTVAIGAVTAAVAAAPAIIGTALAAAPLVFAGISLAAILSSKAVKKEFKDMVGDVMSDIRSIATPMQDEFVHIFGRIREEVSKLKPILAEGFAKSAPLIDVLTTGIFKLAENALPGLVRAVGAAGPTMAALRDGLAHVGDAISYFFTKMAENSQIGAQGMTSLFNGISSLIRGLADLLVWLSTSATAFHAIHDAVMGVVPILFELFVQLEKALGPAFQALVPLVMDLAHTIADFLIPIFQMFQEPLRQVAAALATGLHPAFVALQDVFKVLMPILSRIVSGLGELLVGAIQILAPLLPPLIGAFGDIVAAVLQFIPPLIQIAQLLLPALSDILVAVTNGFLSLVPPLVDLANQLFPIILQTVEDLVRAFVENLVPVLVQVAQQLFPVLVDVLKELVPIFVDLARELLPALVQVFDMLAPIIAQLAKEELPILVSIIRDFVIPLIRDVLAPAISVLAHDVIPALVGVVRDVLVPIFNDALVPAVRLMGQMWKDVLLPILRDLIIPILRVALPEAVKVVSDALHALTDTFKTEFEAVKKFFTDLREHGIKDALGDLSHVLFDSGVALMKGFLDGITSMQIPVVSQVTGVLGAVSNLFPHSPAKEGPFSGQGYTLFSGQALMRDFASGVQSIDIKGIFEKILSGISGTFSAQGSPGGGGTASASIAGLGSIQLKVAPGADSALASLLMNMVRTGQLQLQRI